MQDTTEQGPVELKSNQFWGKRSGSWDDSCPNAARIPVGNIFRQSQWGSGQSNSGPNKKGK